MILRAILGRLHVLHNLKLAVLTKSCLLFLAIVTWEQEKSTTEELNGHRNASNITSSYFNFYSQQHRWMTARTQLRALVRHNVKLLTEIRALV